MRRAHVLALGLALATLAIVLTPAATASRLELCSRGENNECRSPVLCVSEDEGACFRDGFAECISDPSASNQYVCIPVCDPLLCPPV